MDSRRVHEKCGRFTPLAQQLVIENTDDHHYFPHPPESTEVPLNSSYDGTDAALHKRYLIAQSPVLSRCCSLAL